jgi:hypothetical protein
MLLMDGEADGGGGVGGDGTTRSDDSSPFISIIRSLLFILVLLFGIIIGRILFVMVFVVVFLLFGMMVMVVVLCVDPLDNIMAAASQQLWKSDTSYLLWLKERRARW